MHPGRAREYTDSLGRKRSRARTHVMHHDGAIRTDPTKIQRVFSVRVGIQPICVDGRADELKVPAEMCDRE